MSSANRLARLALRRIDRNLPQGIEAEPNHLSFMRTGHYLFNVNTTWGGPPIWDPIARLYRAFAHNRTNQTIDLYTSPDKLRWSYVGAVLTGSGTNGSWEEAGFGVPYAWYEPGQTRPWRMVVVGWGDDGVRAQVVTSTDGATWELKDVAGDDITDPIFTTGEYATLTADHGCMFHAFGKYHYFMNTINNDASVGRTVWLLTSADLLTWTKPTALSATYATFKPRGTADGAWDYDDKNHSSYEDNTAFGWFCPMVYYKPKADGTPSWLMYIMTYLTDSGDGGHDASIAVFESDSPGFEVERREFLGFVNDLATDDDLTASGCAIGTSGSDVPRGEVLDVRNEPAFEDEMWVSEQIANAATPQWILQRYIRPAGLPVATRSTDYKGAVLVNVAGNLPGINPTLQLAPNDDDVLFHIQPGANGTLLDLSGVGQHLVPHKVGWTREGLDLELTTLNGYAHHGAAGYTAVPSRYETVSAFTVEAWVKKESVIGAGTTMAIIMVGGVISVPGLYITGSADDTAATITLAWNNGVGAQSKTSSAVDLSSTGWMHIAAVKSATGVRFFVNGTEVGTEQADVTTLVAPTATNHRIWVGEMSAPVAANSFDGIIGEVRVSKVAQYDDDFTPTRWASVPRQLTGYVFSGVYDFGAQASPAVDVRAIVPALCTLDIGYREAASASDRSELWSAFDSARATGRYCQFAIKLTGNGILTPSVSQVRFRA